MSTYRINNTPNVGPISLSDRLRGQVTISNQTNGEIDLIKSKGIFFIEKVKASSGTLTIVDGEGKAVLTAVSDEDFQICPLMAKYGITITGDILYIKGFEINGILT